MNKKLKLLAVLAHPDDESLGFGGTLAKYAAEGVQTYLVYQFDDRAGYDRTRLSGWLEGTDRSELPSAGGEPCRFSYAQPLRFSGAQGLHLGFGRNRAALLGGDLPRVHQVLQQGLASPEHAAFVAKLAAARGS